ncbi:hypothetical protein ACFX2A_000415 [Malus domestica]
MAIFAASYVEAQLSLCMGQSNYDNGVIVFFLLGKWALRGYLLPLRGFRQSDLLSPYLFHLCTKGFLALLADREWAGLIQGVSIRNGVPLAYELASGQKTNLHKSKICFSRNVKRLDKAQMASVLGVTRVTKHEHYLGLPTVVGRNRSTCFDYIKERLWKHLQGWKGKLLSSAGKELLIKSVAQALPLYLMSSFLLPKYFYDNLNHLIATFWWNGTDRENKIHWLLWEKLCHLEFRGGLGLQNFSAFNLALLAKQAWRLIANLDSLVAQILKAKYFLACQFKDAVIKPNYPFVSRSICVTHRVINCGARWLIRNGASVHIWEDSWVPLPHFLRLISSKLNLGTISWVADLIDHSSHSWKSDLFSQLFSTDEADLIQGIPLNICNSDDRLIWHHNWSIAFMDCPMESKCSSQGSGLLLENV